MIGPAAALDAVSDRRWPNAAVGLASILVWPKEIMGHLAEKFHGG
jgi:hypothetical protein